MKICYRIAQRDWLKDESFEALYRSIEKWKNNIDELAIGVRMSLSISSDS